MERTVYVERLYSLGQFKNIKFASSLTGIPEGVAKNDRAVALIMLQSSIACEIAYRRYYDTVSRIAEEGIKDVLGYLEEERDRTYKELYEEIKTLSDSENKEDE